VTYDSQRLHESRESGYAEAIVCQVKKASVERTPAVDAMPSQHSRTVIVCRKQSVQQTADVIVMTAVQHK